MRLSESVRVRCKTPSKTSETPPFPPISYPALAGLIGICDGLVSSQFPVIPKLYSLPLPMLQEGELQLATCPGAGAQGRDGGLHALHASSATLISAMMIAGYTGSQDRLARAEVNMMSPPFS